MRRRTAITVLFAAPTVALVLVLAACTGSGTPAASSSSSAPSSVSQPQTTAIAVESPHAARFVPASDGTTHIEYDLVITNAFIADVTLTGLVVQDDAGRELGKLQGDDLKAITFKLFSSDPTLTVPPSTAVAVIVDLPLRPDRAGDVPAALQHQVTYTVPDTAPARALIGATTVRGPRIEVDKSAPTVIKSPLRGAGWLNFNGCCVASSAHRMTLLPTEGAYRAFEMLAIDWVQVRGEDAFRGDGAQLTDHFAYGSEIHAATAGEVVDVRNDQPEAPVNASSTGNPTVKEIRDVAGNHVTVRFAPDRFAVYAHLQTGSGRVKVGDQVAAGDILGLLGNSGNSTAPHLHFSIQNGPDALTSDSLPFVIDGYQVTGAARFGADALHVDPASSRQTNTLPLIATVVTFDG